MIEEDDSADVKNFLSKYSVNWEASKSYASGHSIPKTKAKLGVSQVLSVGMPAEDDIQTTAWSVSAGIDSVLRYLDHCLQSDESRGGTCVSPTSDEAVDQGARFVIEEASRLSVCGHDSASRLKSPTEEAEEGGSNSSGLVRHGSNSPKSSGLFRRFRKMVTFDRKSSGSGRGGSGSGGNTTVDAAAGAQKSIVISPSNSALTGAGDLSPTNEAGCQSIGLNERIGIADFDLLKVRSSLVCFYVWCPVSPGQCM